jgi:hypothetical protein
MKEVSHWNGITFTVFQENFVDINHKGPFCLKFQKPRIEEAPLRPKKYPEGIRVRSGHKAHPARRLSGTENT